ncbi:MAG: hypothetical protein M3464_17330, partial [Chloroflexota bacterium]|nr:hypothetical protein [Chloroflexota bacterium]
GTVVCSSPGAMGKGGLLPLRVRHLAPLSPACCFARPRSGSVHGIAAAVARAPSRNQVPTRIRCPNQTFRLTL